MEKALELRNVSIVRNGKYILKSVDLDIFKGENVAVIGPNGSGKTTLIKLLRGDIHPETPVSTRSSAPGSSTVWMCSGTMSSRMTW